MRKLVLMLCVFLMVIGADLNHTVSAAEDELPGITTSSSDYPE